jgi:hypothetical protein
MISAIDKSYNVLRHLLTNFIRNPFEKPQNYIIISFKLILFSMFKSQPFCRYLMPKSKLEQRNKDLKISKSRSSSSSEIRWEHNQQEMEIWVRAGDSQRARLAQARPARGSDLRRSKRSVGHVSSNPHLKKGSSPDQVWLARRS